MTPDRPEGSPRGQPQGPPKRVWTSAATNLASFIRI